MAAYSLCQLQPFYKPPPETLSRILSPFQQADLLKDIPTDLFKNSNLPNYEELLSLKRRGTEPLYRHALFEAIQTWDPRGHMTGWTPLRNELRSELFNESDTTVAETFSDLGEFALSDRQGFIYMAGVTYDVQDKPLGNQDAMAIAKSKDGRTFTALADGVGAAMLSQVAAETYTKVIVEEMAAGKTLRKAGQAAAKLLQKSDPNIFILTLFFILDRYFSGQAATSYFEEQDQFLDDILKGITQNIRAPHHIIRQLIEIIEGLYQELAGQKKPLATYRMQYREKLFKDLSEVSIPPTADWEIFRPPTTTLVVTEKRVEQGKTQIRIHHSGDSGAALFVKTKKGFHLIGQTTPHSHVQKALTNGQMDELARIQLTARNIDISKLTAGEIRQVARDIARNHPASRYVSKTQNKKGTAFFATPSSPDSFTSTDWITLDTDQTYVFLRYTDRLSDTGDLLDFADDLNGADAQEILDNIISHLDHNNGVAETQYRKKFRYPLQVLQEVLTRKKWQQLIKSAIPHLKERAKHPDTEISWIDLSVIMETFMALKKDLVKAGLSQQFVDQYLIPMHYFYSKDREFYSPPHFCVDGGHPDDTTVIVEIIRPDSQ